LIAASAIVFLGGMLMIAYRILDGSAHSLAS